MEALRYFNSFARPFLFLTTLLIAGASGYRLIEGWDIVDCFYMTVITISTVGFGEVRPLSQGGKVFTMFLTISGVIFYGVALNSFIRLLADQKFSEYLIRRRMKRKIEKLKNHIIICGGGYTCIAIAEELEKAGIDFVIIEKSTSGPIAAHLDRWIVLERDALDEDSLLEAGIENAAGLASVLSTDADNLFTVLSARRLNAKLVIQSRITVETTRSKIMQAGANIVVSPRQVGGLQMARSFINPEVQNFMSIVLDRTSSYDFETRVHMVRSEDSYVGKSIRKADFREMGYIVIAVRNPEGVMSFAPSADYLLKEGDDVFMIGKGMRSSPDSSPEPQAV